MMKSWNLEKDKNIEDNLMKDVRNLLRVRKKIDDIAIKNVRNLSRPKKIDDTTIKDIKNLFRLKKRKWNNQR